MFFRFPPDAHWSTDHGAVEFGIGIGEYESVVRVGRRVFQALLGHAPTPERCVEAYHLHRTRLELIAERKVRCRSLTDDGNVEITGRDLRERDARPPMGRGVTMSPFLGAAVADEVVRGKQRRELDDFRPARFYN